MGKMDTLAKELGFEFNDIAAPTVDIPKFGFAADDDDDRDDDDDDDNDEEEVEELLNPNDLDKIRRYLEDTVTLGSSDEELDDSDLSIIDTTSVQVDDIDDEEEDAGFQ